MLPGSKVLWGMRHPSQMRICARPHCYACRSGLRGAVGLSLSLFVLLDQKISDSRYRTLSFFFMGIIAFLTTLIQGTSMGPILQVSLAL